MAIQLRFKKARGWSTSGTQHHRLGDNRGSVGESKFSLSSMSRNRDLRTLLVFKMLPDCSAADLHGLPSEIFVKCYVSTPSCPQTSLPLWQSEANIHSSSDQRRRWVQLLHSPFNSRKYILCLAVCHLIMQEKDRQILRVKTDKMLEIYDHSWRSVDISNFLQNSSWLKNRFKWVVKILHDFPLI